MNKKFLVLAVITTAIVSQRAQADLVYGSNVVLNGDAEAGGGGDGTTTVAIPDWVTSDPVDGMTVVTYGSPGGFPAVGSGPLDEGANFFAGGIDNATSNITQTLNVANQASAINAGSVAFSLSAWLGGYDGQDDDAIFSVTFENASATAISTTTVGPVTEADRAGVTELLPVSTTGVIPAGTTSLVFTLTATRYQGAFDDGYADDLSFVATNNTVPTPPPTVPEPSTFALLGLGLLAMVWNRRKQLPS